MKESGNKNQESLNFQTSNLLCFGAVDTVLVMQLIIHRNGNCFPAGQHKASLWKVTKSCLTLYICFYWLPCFLCHLQHQEADGTSFPSGCQAGNVWLFDSLKQTAKSCSGRAWQELTGFQTPQWLPTGGPSRLHVYSPILPKTEHFWKIRNVDLRYKCWKWD